MNPFHQILGNNLVANVTNFTVWFAVTFWVFLETQSVFATGMIAGIYLVFTAGLGFWLGAIVDHNPKKLAMLGSSAVSFGFYAVLLGVLLLAPAGAFTDPYGPYLWVFVLIVMWGVIAGNLRSIALPTLVTILIPEDRRDKANGLVGMVTGAWCETDGPPIENPPEHKGFGSVLLQRLLGGLPGASVDVRYPREGLCVDVQLRMADE